MHNYQSVASGTRAHRTLPKVIEMKDPLDNREIRRLLRSVPGEAIKILWLQYHQGLLKIAFRLTHDEDAAKDVVQEAFSHVWANASKLDEHHQCSIEHYLVRIVRNKSMTYYKNQILLSKKKIKWAGGLNRSEDSVESHIIEVELTREIRDVIGRFPARERECLALKLDEELTNPQISARLGVGIKAVERSLTSARKRLRKELHKRFNKTF